MKLFSLLVAGTFISVVSGAQINSPNVVASGGSFFTAGTFTNSFTIGEMTMVETFSTGSFMLTQGFQQPDDFASVVISQEYLHEFAAYPNPSNGSVSFEYTLSHAGKVYVTVSDAIGQIVYNSSEEKLAGAQRDQLNLSAFANGLYTVRYVVETPEGTMDSFVSRVTLAK